MAIAEIFSFASIFRTCSWKKVYKNWRSYQKLRKDNKFSHFWRCTTGSHDILSEGALSLLSLAPKKQKKKWISNNFKNKYFSSVILALQSQEHSSLIPKKSVLRCNKNVKKFLRENKRREKMKFRLQRHNVCHVYEMNSVSQVSVSCAVLSDSFRTFICLVTVVARIE